MIDKIRTLKKIEFEIELHIKNTVKIRITHLSDSIKKCSVNTNLFTNNDGFIINTGYSFNYNNNLITIPTYKTYDDYNDIDMVLFKQYKNERDKYKSLKYLYDILIIFSQSRIFQYDNTGFIETDGKKWIVY